MRFRGLPLLCAAVVIAAPVHAQVGVPTERTVTGVVVDSISGKTIRGARLFLDQARVEVQSGRDGRFVLEHGAMGDSLLVVHSVGYVPALLVVPPSRSAAEVDIGRVLMRQVATRLDQIAVEAEEVRVFPQLVDFYRRKQEGVPGDFFTREDIDRSAARKVSELLYRSAKLDMDCPHDPVRAGDDRCVARDRRGLDYRVTQGVTSRCVKDIFVDGKRSQMAVDEIPVQWVAAVEVYAGPATTPAQFGQRPCGVIAIWTTRAGRG